MKNSLTFKKQAGFSLVEVLAAVGIIGIIAFLAIPNIVSIKSQSERELAISKAEAINMAIASYIQANGRDIAQTDYASAGTGDSYTVENNRYQLLAPYMAFSPENLEDYKPNSYEMNLPNDLSNLEKTYLEDPDGVEVKY